MTRTRSWRRVAAGGATLLLSATALAACGQSRAEASDPNAAVHPSAVYSKPPSKQASGEYPSGFVTGPSTTVPAYPVPTEKELQSLLLDSGDVQKDWTARGTGGIAACATSVPAAAGTAASAEEVFYATGSSTPVLVEVMSSYQPSVAATAYSDTIGAIGRCHSISVLAGTQRLAGTVTSTGPVVSDASSESYQAALEGNTLHAGVAVIHDHNVGIGLVYLTRSAPDPQSLKTYSNRAVAKLTEAGL